MREENKSKKLSGNAPKREELNNVSDQSLLNSLYLHPKSKMPSAKNNS